MEQLKDVGRKLLLGLLLAGTLTASFFVGRLYEKIQNNKEEQNDYLGFPW